MEPLEFQPTNNTPHVILNARQGIFEIKGRSLPEKATAFYQPVLEWITEYSLNPNAATDFVFKLEYINTGSSKSILNLLTLLQRINGARVVWCFQDDDDDMEEVGEELSELVKIPFEFKPY